MKVSIIIPIYKVEDEIERCLKSVLDQTYNNIELVLVNDATPDRSFRIAREYLTNGAIFNERTIYLEHKINLGVSVARNTGITHATGDYLFFLDSDDELADNNSINLLVEALKGEKELDIVVGGFNHINSLNNITSNCSATHTFLENKDIYTYYVKNGILITPWAKLIRKNFLIDNDLFFKEGIYHEDFLWSFRSYRIARKLKILSRAVYNYYDREDSITSAFREKNLVDLVTVAEEISIIYHNNPQYFPRETMIILETTKRTVFRYLSLFTNQEFILTQLNRLKMMRLGIFSTKKTSLIRFNILLRQPNIFLLYYLRKKKFKIKKFGEA